MLKVTGCIDVRALGHYDFEFYVQDDIVVVYTRLVIAGNPLGIDRTRVGTGDILHQVNEVANLSDDPATTFLFGVNPVISWHKSGIYPVTDHHRVFPGEKKLLYFSGVWGKAPVVANHHVRTFASTIDPVGACLNDLIELLPGSAKRFLNKYVFT